MLLIFVLPKESIFIDSIDLFFVRPWLVYTLEID